MAKQQLIVNGYKVPGGYSGVAVRRACEFVIANPGVSQVDLLQEAVRFSGINMSTAGWITSPGNPWNGKSPATVLWDRRKQGVFRCYPNEHTDKVVGAQAALFDEIMNGTRLQLRGVKYRPVPGELVNFHSTVGDVYTTGLFIGYSFGRMNHNDPLFNSIQDIIDARPACTYGDRVYMDTIENGTGCRMKDWMLGSVSPA
jgi:hypothetical protein